MSVTHVLGFAVVAGIIVAGVDYHQQSQKADLALGELSPGDYIATFKQRFDGAQEEKRLEAETEEREKRWRAGGKPYLPEAPEGWVRNALTEGDNKAVLPRQNKAKTEQAGGALLVQMEERQLADRLRKLSHRSWVYKRGNEVVSVEVRQRNEASGNSLAGLLADSINGMHGGTKLEGYAVIGGVGFAEELLWNDEREHHYRILSGTIGFGQELELVVHANASRAATREILEAIDYDGLNALLIDPVESIGNDATLPEGVSEQQLAENLVELRNEFLSLKAREAQYRINNMNPGALIVNTYLQGYTGVDGAVDLTGGQKVSLKTLINLGYRKGLAALMAGQSLQEASEEIHTMIEHAMAQVSALSDEEGKKQRDEAPQMSPELAAELGYMQLEQTEGEASVLDNFINKTFTAKELAFAEEHADTAEWHNDEGDQIAARVMEYRHGMPAGDCLVNHSNAKIYCGKNAEKQREMRKTAAATKEEQGGLSKLWGAVSSAWSGEEETASASTPAGEKPKRIQLSGGSSCLEGSAGKFCKN